MRSFFKILLVTIFMQLFFTKAIYAACKDCCQGMGGIQYCDSSAGRYVCQNGYYSSCYCTIHAVMDLQRVSGCCLWQGGVMLVDPNGLVICNDGGTSEVCTLENTSKSKTIY